jgi:transposase-like protein
VPGATQLSSGGTFWILSRLAGRALPGLSAQCIYTWRRQQLIDSGQLPGVTSTHHAELVAALRRMAELENEMAVHRRATALGAWEARFPRGAG